MSSNDWDISQYAKDERGPYYTDKNNYKIHFLKDDKGYYYLDHNNKVHIPDKTKKEIKKEIKKENNVEIEDTKIGKLSTYLMKKLSSSGYINNSIDPHEIRNIIKIGINEFININPSARCQATITTKNYSYKCNAPVKPGSESCGRKHKK